jgi:hypothetical protein
MERENNNQRQNFGKERRMLLRSARKNTERERDKAHIYICVISFTEAAAEAGHYLASSAYHH